VGARPFFQPREAFVAKRPSPTAVLNTAIIAAAAKAEVERRLAQGWRLADGATEAALVERLAAELTTLRRAHRDASFVPLERLEEWLAHAAYEMLVNEFADVFAPVRAA
jgi:hypothetical protein